MIARTTLLIAMLALAGCAARSPSPDVSRPAVDAVLDDFHAAAAEADADRYLAHFTDDGVFFGTDATERGTKQQFTPYVRDRFAAGGWSYVPRDRTVFFSEDGNVAWFDEMMTSRSGTVARGTGVLVRDGGAWQIAQYNFSVPFPNSLWDTILELIRAEAQ